MTIKATPYDELMAQRLQDKALAIAYLNESLQDEDDLTMFLVALRRVVDAQGVRMTELSKRSGITRESLYKMLSDKGNPELASIKSVLDALGYRLSISLEDSA